VTRDELRKKIEGRISFCTLQKYRPRDIADQIMVLIDEAGYVKTKYSSEEIERVMKILTAEEKVKKEKVVKVILNHAKSLDW